jgi:regulator of protease activity HflC (stomatin/prohibitin superfamily)
MDVDEDMYAALEEFVRKVRQAKKWEQTRKVITWDTEQTLRNAVGKLKMQEDLEERAPIYERQDTR